MTRTRRALLACSTLAAAATAAALITPPAAAATPSPPGNTVRFATFNASLNRARRGPAASPTCRRPTTPRPATVAEIIQRVRPDVLLINEFDFDADGTALRLFQQQLPVRRRTTAPRRSATRYRFIAPSNTGIPSGFDLNNYGTSIGGPGRRLRLRRLPGPVRHGRLLAATRSTPTTSGPSSTSSGRTCRARCCPTTRPPRRRPTGTPPRSWPSSRCRPRATGTCRSRSAARPSTSWSATPPRRCSTVPRTATARRNHDEIRLWADYVTPGAERLHLRRRRQARRARARGAAFVIAGRPELRPARRRQHPRLDPAAAGQPAGQHHRHPDQRRGRSEQAEAAGRGRTSPTESDPRVRHRRLRRQLPGPGNLRADYVLPSSDLRIRNSGIFWPTVDDPFFYLDRPGVPGPEQRPPLGLGGRQGARLLVPVALEGRPDDRHRDRRPAGGAVRGRAHDAGAAVVRRPGRGDPERAPRPRP